MGLVSKESARKYATERWRRKKAEAYERLGNKCKCGSIHELSLFVNGVIDRKMYSASKEKYEKAMEKAELLCKECRPYRKSIYGSNNAFAKLTDEQVVALRKEYAEKPFQIRPRARQIGVSHATLLCALKGTTFPHLEGAVKTGVVKGEKRQRLKPREKIAKPKPEKPPVVVKPVAKPNPPAKTAPKVEPIKVKPDCEVNDFICYHLALTYSEREAARMLGVEKSFVEKAYNQYNLKNYRADRMSYRIKNPKYALTFDL